MAGEIMKPVRVDQADQRLPGQRYLGQCVHVWRGFNGQETCMNCAAACERDQRGKISVYQTAEAEDRRKS